MDFDRRKTATLSLINTPPQDYTDKSPKGTLDLPILPLLNAINSHPSFFTTSSCSGRISILSTPTATATTKKKARGGNWVLISHDPVEPTSVLDLLYNPTSIISEPQELVLRFEPLIIAVECRDVVSAQSLVSIAISCGFRESGITSVSKRVIVAIRCSIRLEVPLGDSCNLMVSPDYVRFLVGIANEKMEVNRRRTDHFFATLLSNGFGGQENGVGTGDDDGLECGEAERMESCLGSVSESSPEGNRGSAEVPVVSLSIEQVIVSGEPFEKIYLWGHSSCVIGNATEKKVLIFGGFGGMGRHARRNDCFLLDPFSGKLEEFDVQGRPSPRLGHTSSLIGHIMYVIGGRGDPSNILNDVWLLNTENRQWKLVQCTGTDFPSRHRHAAAAIGPKIYIFGGVHNDSICSSLHVLDTQNLKWSEIYMQGEWPCPRHSHSMVSYGSKLYIFGGYDGEKALGDLYSFDVSTCLWKKESMARSAPHARFSHSMFVYKDYVGIIGGCPVKQHYQNLSILDLRACLWKHFRVNSIDQELFVRSSGNVIADDLVMVGGGAACYAFGTKFSDPLKLDLRPLLSLADSPAQVLIRQASYNHGNPEEIDNVFTDSPASIAENLPSGDSDFNHDDESLDLNRGHEVVASHFVLRLEKKYAKLGKDLLKKFGWLDLERKVYSQESGLHICFPVTRQFCGIYDQNEHDSHAADTEPIDYCLLKEIKAKGLLPEISFASALGLLMECGATKLVDEVAKVKKTSSSPLKLMTESVTLLLNKQGLPTELLQQLPTRWERLGDIVVLPSSSFKDPSWDLIAEKLWPTVAASLDTQRLARQGVADRVCLGLLPTSEGSWVTAVRALRSKGGMLHVHANVKDSEEVAWSKYVSKSISDIAIAEGHQWKVSVQHVEKVKWYAPHIRHLVADVRCEQFDK